MFSAAGLFKGIQCPNGDRCILTQCIFNHDDVASRTDSTRNSQSNISSTIPTAQVVSQTKEVERSVKRRKLNDDTNGNHAHISGRQTLPSAQKPPSLPTIEDVTSHEKSARKATSSAIDHARHPKTVSRPISPPKSTIKARLAKPALARLAEDVKPVALIPKAVPHEPAGFQHRMRLLATLHDEFIRLNEDVQKSMDESDKQLALPPNALARRAVEEEHKVAVEEGPVYSNIMKQYILKYKKMKIGDWIKARKEAKAAAVQKQEQPQGQKGTKELDSGLSPAEDITIARSLVADLNGLDQFEYVTTPPTEDEIAAASRGVEAAAGYETCERCQTRFQVFPDRREDGTLTSGGNCRHHWGRRLYPKREKTDAIKGTKEAHYTCCNALLGDPGCTVATQHIFTVKDPKRLASVLPFERTPSNEDADPNLVITFDCEMGYTTKGFELIRLSAVTWPQNVPLIDVLVRPIGQILDLNTRFSGVTTEQFVNAQDLDIQAWLRQALVAASLQREGPRIEASKTLDVVSSPAVARSLLTSLISPDTPLIGHAINNDLNVLRLVHPTIIDTSIIFGHPRGLPFRFSLRDLVFKFLGRQIQAAGAAGHDSLEDSIATGDLVRWKVRKEWQRLSEEGWTVRNRDFYAPSTTSQSGSKGHVQSPTRLPVVQLRNFNDRSQKRKSDAITNTDGAKDADG